MGRNERVVLGGSVPDRIAANLGYPLKLQMDNRPELVSLTLAQGAPIDRPNENNRAIRWAYRWA